MAKSGRPGLQRRSVPLSVALLNRRSIGGAVAVMMVALFFIVVLPAIEDSIEQDNLAVGSTLAVGPSLTVTPGPNWVLKPGSNDDFTTLTQGGAQLIITPASPVDGEVSDQIQSSADALANDPDASWVVAEPATFTTTAGDTGATVTAQSKESVAQIWIISDGEQEATLWLSSPVAVWEGVSEGAAEIASSVVFTDTELP